MSEALKLAQDVQRSHLSTVEAKQVAAALIDLHERMGKIAELAEVSDSNGFPYKGLRSILALTKGKV